MKAPIFLFAIFFSFLSISALSAQDENQVADKDIYLQQPEDGAWAQHNTQFQGSSTVNFSDVLESGSLKWLVWSVAGFVCFVFVSFLTGIADEANDHFLFFKGSSIKSNKFAAKRKLKKGKKSVPSIRVSPSNPFNKWKRINPAG